MKRTIQFVATGTSQFWSHLNIRYVSGSKNSTAPDYYFRTVKVFTIRFVACTSTSRFSPVAQHHSLSLSLSCTASSLQGRWLALHVLLFPPRLLVGLLNLLRLGARLGRGDEHRRPPVDVSAALQHEPHEVAKQTDSELGRYLVGWSTRGHPRLRKVCVAQHKSGHAIASYERL